MLYTKIVHEEALIKNAAIRVNGTILLYVGATRLNVSRLTQANVSFQLNIRELRLVRFN